jgi:hypothetical protein
MLTSKPRFFPAFDVFLRRSYRVMRATPRPEPVAMVTEVFFDNRTQYLMDPLMDQPIDYGRYSQRSYQRIGVRGHFSRKPFARVAPAFIRHDEVDHCFNRQGDQGRFSSRSKQTRPHSLKCSGMNWQNLYQTIFCFTGQTHPTGLKTLSMNFRI